MPAMGAAMAALASAASAASPVHAATQFQHGSTQFNHCHFTQSVAPHAQLDDKAGPPEVSQALSQGPNESQSIRGEHALLAASSGSCGKPEPGAAQPLAGATAHAASPTSTAAALGDRLQLPMSKEPQKAVRLKPAHSAAARSSSLPRMGRDLGKTRPAHAPIRSHAAQPKQSTAQKSRPKKKAESQTMDVDRAAAPAQPAFDYAKALAALDSQGAGHQLHSTGKTGSRCCVCMPDQLK